MKGDPYRVSLFVEVWDPQLLWDAALKDMYPHLKRITKEQIKDAKEMIGTREEPDIGNCLRMVADPGQSWPGTEILDSECE